MFAKIKEASEKKYNLGLVSLPGSGATFYLKKIVEEKMIEDVRYIYEPGQELGDFNLLDLDFNKDKKALEIADSYIKSAGTKQKFVVVINTPEVLKTPRYLESITSNRIFEYVYMPQMDEYRATILATNSLVDFDELVIKKIINKTGGIARLVKYFLLHQNKIEWDYKKLEEEKEFNAVFLPTIKSIKQCDKETLEKMGIVSGNMYFSPLLQEYFEIYTKLEISFDLGGVVYEKGLQLEGKFLKHEIELLKLSLENDGLITKEEVSRVRWGEGDYEKFSDQAIKKIVLRINKKLKEYIFEAVPTIGYKLTQRNG